MRRFAQAIVLLAIGAAAYYAAPVALRLARPAPEPPAAPIAVAHAPGVPAHRSSAERSPVDDAGDIVLLNSLATLERRAAVEAELVQSGHVLGRPVEIAGVYRQKGRGDQRRFATLLQGRVAGVPARLWQVSDGMFLHTDLAWAARDEHDNSGERRSVTRVDLREVRQEILRGSGADPSEIAMGQAAAVTLDPTASAAFGGLPMLLESLGANFHFGAPRKMYLHNEPVFVMIGRWKPASRAALAADPAGTPRGETTEAAASGAAVRLPHHVQLMLGAADLFPYLIEYRGPDDALSAAGLTDDARLRQSGRPLLRLEFRRPRFDVELADTHFEYPASAPGGIREITAQRIATLRKRQQLRLAARATASVRRR